MSILPVSTHIFIYLMHMQWKKLHSPKKIFASHEKSSNTSGTRNAGCKRFRISLKHMRRQSGVRDVVEHISQQKWS